MSGLESGDLSAPAPEIETSESESGVDLITQGW